MSKVVKSLGNDGDAKDRFEIAFWTRLVILVAVAIYYWKPTSLAELVGAVVGYCIIVTVARSLLDQTARKMDQIKAWWGDIFRTRHHHLH